MDDELIDALKLAFGYKSDVEVAGFLGVDKQTVYAARHGITPLGERQRFKIINKVAYRKTENLALRALPKSLIEKILEIRRDQQEHWALGETEDGPSIAEDSQLMDLYKTFRGFRTDQEMADTLGIKRSAISNVRTGRSKLGPLPRLRMFRDVWGEKIEHLEEALESSQALLKMVREYIDAKARREAVAPPNSDQVIGD